LWLFSGTTQGIIPPKIFELDGNALNETYPDWNSLYKGDVGDLQFSGVIPGNGLASFTGGGSKVCITYNQIHY
jgi:hypothetical protein